jgi:hypothetical protein
MKKHWVMVAARHTEMKRTSNVILYWIVLSPLKLEESSHCYYTGKLAQKTCGVWSHWKNSELEKMHTASISLATTQNWNEVIPWNSNGLILVIIISGHQSRRTSTIQKEVKRRKTKRSQVAWKLNQISRRVMQARGLTPRNNFIILHLQLTPLSLVTEVKVARSRY